MKYLLDNSNTPLNLLLINKIFFSSLTYSFIASENVIAIIDKTIVSCHNKKTPIYSFTYIYLNILYNLYISLKTFFSIFLSILHLINIILKLSVFNRDCKYFCFNLFQIVLSHVWYVSNEYIIYHFQEFTFYIPFKILKIYSKISAVTVLNYDSYIIEDFSIDCFKFQNFAPVKK